LTSKARYKKLLRGLVIAAIENNENLEALKQALTEVAAEIERLKLKP
jgi:hypothetical protein